ncbi:lytic transglycosylase [Gluconobacter phage GC1]|uniref:Lytic transglycosylase n=1 Tax=Gluconobacter phage GC1 TaxID=2047788 RepID=A0A2I5AR86_9VIRU|nr:lytic transglycosylase [Gluconobacter phage GC1]ATS92590.1 lytic transglycosylase [Gluconobacter phage GC1]
MDWWDNEKSAPYHDDLIAGAAASGGTVTPQELANQIGQESGFDPNAKSTTSSATGIAQILKSTAENPGYGLSSVDPTDASASIRFAGAYDGKVGVSGYSGGNYSKADLDSGTTSGSGATGATGTADTKDEGSGGSDTEDASDSDAGGLMGIIEEFGTRMAVIVLGIVFILIALYALTNSKVQEVAASGASRLAKMVPVE